MISAIVFISSTLRAFLTMIPEAFEDESFNRLIEFQVMNEKASIGTSFSRVRNLFGNSDSASQYGSLIVSCDVVGSLSLILVGGESDRGP